MTANRAPEVTFNYLGQVDSLFGDGLFAPADEPSGPQVSPANGRAHLLEINAIVVGGRLSVDWHFSRALHRRATIEALASAHLDGLRTMAERYPASTRAAHSTSFIARDVDERDVEAALAEADQLDL